MADIILRRRPLWSHVLRLPLLAWRIWRLWRVGLPLVAACYCAATSLGPPHNLWSGR